MKEREINIKWRRVEGDEMKALVEVSVSRANANAFFAIVSFDLNYLIFIGNIAFRGQGIRKIRL